MLQNLSTKTYKKMKKKKKLQRTYTSVGISKLSISLYCLVFALGRLFFALGK